MSGFVKFSIMTRHLRKGPECHFICSDFDGGATTRHVSFARCKLTPLTAAGGPNRQNPMKFVSDLAHPLEAEHVFLIAKCRGGAYIVGCFYGMILHLDSEGEQ
jgi:hypothetical protein